MGAKEVTTPGEGENKEKTPREGAEGETHREREGETHREGERVGETQRERAKPTERKARERERPAEQGLETNRHSGRVVGAS